MALAMGLGIAGAASAEPLLAPIGDESTAAATLPGVRRAARLALGRDALAALRRRDVAVVEAFPLGTARTATLELRRFRPFGPRTRVEVMEADGPRRLTMPDAAYFTGGVRGEPGSRAVLVAREGAVHGFVATGGDLFRFGPDRTNTHRSFALADVEPGAAPPPGAFCLNDAHPRLAAAMAARGPARLAPPVAAAGLRKAELAIETDRELRQKFASDDEALVYLGELLAAASAIYERDVSVQLEFSYIRLWGAVPADPWTATDTIDALDEVQQYWLDPGNDMDTIAGARDLVHFISGKDVSGGVAYVGALCDQAFGFGVSQVYGGFDLANPATVWDVLVFTHEVGHNFGSPHSHCYDPPVDRCYNVEPGCWDGAVVQSRGTIMSYCHLLGGVENVDLLFGGTVSNQIVATVAGAGCLDTLPGGTCGNAVIEAGEQCDDGGFAPGDGCSAACRFEVCGNALLDPGEVCDDGNTVSGDGCSPACQPEALCGDGSQDAGEECDDGNGASGDGCSAQCQAEPCLVLRSGQTVWAKAKLTVKRQSALTMTGTFSLGVPVEQLGLDTAGARLLLEAADGERRVDLALPPGAAWVVRPGKWFYRDPAGAAGGVRRVIVRDRTRGGVPDVQVKITGRGAYALAAEDLPVAVTLVLGDAAAGQAGACGRFAFDGGSCRVTKSRITCR